jgi:hypothetical protein
MYAENTIRRPKGEREYSADFLCGSERYGKTPVISGRRDLFLGNFNRTYAVLV